MDIQETLLSIFCLQMHISWIIRVQKQPILFITTWRLKRLYRFPMTGVILLIPFHIDAFYANFTCGTSTPMVMVSPAFASYFSCITQPKVNTVVNAR